MYNSQIYQTTNFYGHPQLQPVNINNTQIHSQVGQVYYGNLGIYEIASDVDLGSGSYGSVKLVLDIHRNHYFAMKIICKQKMHQYQAEQNIRQEIILQSSLDNKYILKIIEAFEDHYNLYIILECCPQGTLFDVIQKKQKMSEEEAFPYIYQITLGLDYLHKQGIAHRDIKPENILICDDHSIKICDFNWAIKLLGYQTADPILCGTTEYMPPEVILGKRHDFRTDIWSLGIVFYQMLHGHVPFIGTTQKEKCDAVLSDKHLDFDQKVSLYAQVMIHQLLCRTILHRPNTEQIFNSKWMKKMMKSRNYLDPYPDYKITLDLSSHTERSEFVGKGSNSALKLSQHTTGSIENRKIQGQSLFKSMQTKIDLIPSPHQVKNLPYPAFHDQHQRFVQGISSLEYPGIIKSKSQNSEPQIFFPIKNIMQ